MGNLPPAVLRALARQRQLRGQRGLADYESDLYNRVLPPTGDANAKGGGIMPIQPAAVASGTLTQEQMIQEIVALLQTMPAAMSLNFRQNFAVEPRERLPFIATAAPTTLGAGATATIVSQLVDEKFGGMLTNIGVGVEPPGSFSSIKWYLKVNGSTHPKFSGLIFNANTLATPLLFSFEICSSRTVELVAENVGLGAINVSGLLVGWTEFLSENKGYGYTPSSGIG